jgi:hypothetical protein
MFKHERTPDSNPKASQLQLALPEGLNIEIEMVDL